MSVNVDGNVWLECGPEPDMRTTMRRELSAMFKIKRRNRHDFHSDLCMIG